jgi:hypothetical protein
MSPKSSRDSSTIFSRLKWKYLISSWKSAQVYLNFEFQINICEALSQSQQWNISFWLQYDCLQYPRFVKYQQLFIVVSLFTFHHSNGSPHNFTTKCKFHIQDSSCFLYIQKLKKWYILFNVWSNTPISKYEAIKVWSEIAICQKYASMTKLLVDIGDYMTM